MPTDNAIRITVDQIDQAIQQAIGLADTTRASGLDVFLQLAHARDAGYRREFTRLSQVLPPNDPQLAALTLRMEASTALRQEVAFEVQRSDTGIPDPIADAWTLHGFIRGVDPATLEDKSVALSDSKGAGITASDTPIENAGRFVIHYKAPTATPVPAARSDTPPVEVFVSVIDGRHRIIYKDPRALKPQNGTVTAIELDLSGGAAPLIGTVTTSAPPLPDAPVAAKPPSPPAKEIVEPTPNSESARTQPRRQPRARRGATNAKPKDNEKPRR